MFLFWSNCYRPSFKWNNMFRWYREGNYSSIKKSRRSS